MQTVSNQIIKRMASTFRDNRISIVLIQPYGLNPKIVLPLSLSYLKANLDEKICDVNIIDCALRGLKSNSEEFKKLLQSYEPHIIGVSAWTQTYQEALDILKISKIFFKNVITVIGGSHASANYKEVVKNEQIDFLFRGESEFTFPLFINRILNNIDFSNISGLVYRRANGELIINEPLVVNDIDKIKIPSYDSINLDEYIESGYRYHTREKYNAPILLTRGCPYTCQFCSVSLVNGKRVRKHGPGYVIRWIKYLYYEKGIRHINIIDDNFTFDVEYAKNICKQIIQLNLKRLSFGTPNGIRMQRGDRELWGLMKKAGWKSIIVAPESGSTHTLKLMRKNLKKEIVPNVVDDMKKMGLYVQGYFIIGYPGETKNDLLETRKLIMKTRFDLVSMFRFQPLPGTPVFDSLVEKSEISKDFLPNDYYSRKPNYETYTLRKVNIPLFYIITYFLFFLQNPKRICFLVSKYDIYGIFKRIIDFNMRKNTVVMTKK